MSGAMRLKCEKKTGKGALFEMKRFFAALLAAALASALICCARGGDSFTTETPSEMPSQANAETSAPAEETAAAVTPKRTDAPIELSKPPIESTPAIGPLMTFAPTLEPLTEQTGAAAPTAAPTPTTEPTPAPTGPTTAPVFTPEPTQEPTTAPTSEPTAAPTTAPTQTPTPTAAPTQTPKPTAAPTQTPTAAPTATPKPTQTPAPTAQPGQSAISLTQSANLPLPSTNEDLPQGQPFCFGGVVKCDSPILSVTAKVTTQSGANAISGSVSFTEAQNVRRVELVDPTFPKENDTSLTKKLKFEELASGSYTFSLYAEAARSGSTLLYSSAFKVVGGEWRQLISNNLRNCYAYALSFFGSRDQFMFRYRWAQGRQIEVESSWLYPRMTSVTSPSGQTWYVHKKAAPHYNSAINYMKTSFVRVRGTSDSGVIRLWELVSTFDGILNTRFVSARDFVSHHAFGTAIDLNASMTPNNNALANRALILSEVRDKLVYNGIKTENGVSYYDFTYTGNYSEKHRSVPTTVVNYLLYELAFYRAGFSWGYYYRHACDAMHFGLSEMSADTHNTSDRSLRKVYSYIG